MAIMPRSFLPPGLPPAANFATAPRGVDFDAWPPVARRAKNLYFREDGGLSLEAPATADDAADAYLSDPDKPVPYTMEIGSGWTRGYMVED